MSALVDAGVLVEDQLFSTLDPTTRRMQLPGGEGQRPALQQQRDDDDDKGDVERAYMQVPELRGFEVFSLGRPAEDDLALLAELKMPVKALSAAL